MAQQEEAHQTHTQNEYIVAAVTGSGLFLGIAVGIFDAFGTTDEFLGLSLTNILYIAILLVVIGAALWLALLRPWENFDDLKEAYYKGHDHDDDHADHSEADDLTLIEGVGPKAKDALAAGGFGTFRKVAGASVDDLQGALDAAGSRMSLLKPDTWPRQAQYVVDGDAEGLEAYQDELRGGVDVEPDDLTIIEGVGPKAKDALAAGGFGTFRKVAGASVDDLQGALDAAGSRMSLLKPESWPRQAQYIVDGDVEGLEAYQDKLRGGVDLEPDDLTIIEGVGPKAKEALIAAGIGTFEKVAAASVESLQAALDAAGSRMSLLKPETWPKQAQFVVDGDAEGLDAYQDKLRGGIDPDA